MMADDIPLTRRERILKSQLNNEENNPCYEEHVLSLKCLSESNYDKDKCQLYFTNYNNCKKFWNTVKTKRRSDGTKPYLPPLEERQVIKEKFLKTGTL